MDVKIIDESNDRMYFTIVPNYILNHSSGIDKGLYLDMKRMAGEDGLCFMTEATMCKRNGIGEKQLHKSLKYLLDHKWIEFTGTSEGKTRPIKTYKIIDIWKINSEYYKSKKIVAESGVSSEKAKDSRQKQDKIVAESRGILRTNIKEELTTTDVVKRINRWAYTRASTPPSCTPEAFNRSVRLAISRVGEGRVIKVFEDSENAIQFLVDIKSL